MATFTATRAGSRVFSAGAGWAQDKKVAWGTIEITANPAPADIYQMCKIPKGAVIVGGRLLGERLGSGTSAGSISYTLNVGIDGTLKVTDATSYGTASTSNALGTIASIDYAAVVGVRGESGLDMPLGGLLYTTGPFTVTGGAASAEEAFAIVTYQTSTTSFITGTMSLEVDYYIGSHT